MTAPRKALRYLWAAPVSCFGIMLSFSCERRYVTRGILLAEGARWPRRLRWRYRAITLGHVVLSVDKIDEVTFEHEMVHVRQYERWGPLFLVIYPSASLIAWLQGRSAYRDNVFELAARRVTP